MKKKNKNHETNKNETFFDNIVLKGKYKMLIKLFNFVSILFYFPSENWL